MLFKLPNLVKRLLDDSIIFHPTGLFIDRENVVILLTQPARATTGPAHSSTKKRIMQPQLATA